jgi:glyoxylase-like metal-dependent hydrolase (beta-lactamase superfamily II)/rhodanese-related sulfurtransferase
MLDWGLRQFRHEGCLSYAIFDQAAGEALLVDPRTDLLEEYRELLSTRKLRLSLVIDTRLHWHHLSASHLLAEAYGAPVGMGEATRSERVTRRLRHGERFGVGALELTVLATPGVSPDAICLHGGGALWSGDTIVPESGARTDLAGGDPEALWKSLRLILSPLAAATLVLPGYAPGDVLFSTLGLEKERGPDWDAPSLEELVREKAEQRARGEGETRHRLEYNLKARPTESSEAHFGSGLGRGAAAGPMRGIATISVEKCALKLRERQSGTLCLDVREAEEFAAGHAEGALNLPLPELPLGLERLRGYKRIYVMCQNGRRSDVAARTLDYLGLGDVVYVDGGFKAWQNAGLPVTGP